MEKVLDLGTINVKHIRFPVFMGSFVINCEFAS